MSGAEEACPLIIHADPTESIQVHKLKEKIEKGNDEEKIDALKKTILYLLGGEQAPQLLIPIIRYVMPSKNHKIKKLLLLYWELLDKQQQADTMVLVCNALLRDVNYPNEYVRGSTLRFLAKLKNQELLQPLVESIRNNLEHRHAYVKRNAVLAIYHIYKEFPNIIPDAPHLILDFLTQEGDPSCKRNAFLMLFNTSRDQAIDYLNSVLDQVQSFGEILQLVVVEMIRKVVRNQPKERGKYIRCIFTLLSSPSAAVQYEAAQTIVTLSAVATAIKAAANTYVNLLVRESDNNVKMIVLDRLMELKEKYLKILQNLVMDVLRGMHSPDPNIRNKTLAIALDLVTPANVHDVINLLKKEIHKTQSDTFQGGSEYRHVLVKAIHSCAVKFPEIASDIVHDLMEFLGDESTSAASDVVEFVREVMQTYTHLRASLLQKLVSCLYQIKSGKVFRSALWIIGEYAESSAQIESAFAGLQEVLGDPLSLLVLNNSEVTMEVRKENVVDDQPVYSGPKILPDGTYASASALSVSPSAAESRKDSYTSSYSGLTLKQLLQMGDFFLGSVLATTLTKLALKLERQKDVSDKIKNSTKAKILLYLTSLLKLCKENKGGDVDYDSYERIVTCFKMATENVQEAVEVYLKNSRESFAHYLATQQQIAQSQQKKDEKSGVIKAQVDDLLKIRQLKSQNVPSELDEEAEELDLDRATGATHQDDYGERLNRIVQLTGWSDPIYAEAYVNVHQYDILLDVTVINQTADTLQNLSLELSTLGDLKLLERPTNYTLGAYSKRNIKANIKVSSTETGIIFGSIIYEIAGAAGTEKIVQLSEIHIDIIDYISPATTDDTSFRRMWAEFEWENKVAVNTSMINLREYLNNIMKATNMACLTPVSSLEGDCGFLSANLYAKSAFDEDALANVSIELTDSGRILGFIRIRSKTQGIAISLGEKITQKQKA
uniref:Coatomer subunit beta n=1 Tax=Arcella intermedia TaxID=1963864 RepID=A0A6B2KXK3_9EUKA